MIRLMRSSGAIRHVWVMLALAAFALRVVVPAGYMLGTDPDTGEIGVYLCPQGGGSSLADWIAPPEPKPHHSDQAHHSGQEHHSDSDPQDSACPFALTGTPLISDEPSLVASGLDYTLVTAALVNGEAPPSEAIDPTARPRAPPSLRV